MRLSRAAATAAEVRSAMRSARGRVGVARGFHLPLASSSQKTSSRPWAMAKERSVAHFGTTRSGHRCMARCDQSYSPATSSRHDSSAFERDCRCGISRWSGAALTTTPSSTAGFHSRAHRSSSTASARSSSTSPSAAAISARVAAVEPSKSLSRASVALRSARVSRGLTTSLRRTNSRSARAVAATTRTPKLPELVPSQKYAGARRRPLL
jgi:hypothetical protein